GPLLASARRLGRTGLSCPVRLPGDLLPDGGAAALTATLGTAYAIKTEVRDPGASEFEFVAHRQATDKLSGSPPKPPRTSKASSDSRPSSTAICDDVGTAQAGRFDRAGLPKTVAPEGTLRVTTLPAPTSASSPISTPGRISAPLPIQTLRPMRTGRPNSRPPARSAGSLGWSAQRIWTPAPIC